MERIERSTGGIIVPWVTGSEPNNFTFRHPLNAELHDVRIYNKYISGDDVVTGSRDGPPDNDWARQGLVFYLPVFFTKERSNRLCLYNAVQNFHTSYYMPTFSHLTYDDTLSSSDWNGFRYYLDGRGSVAVTAMAADSEFWAAAYPNQTYYNTMPANIDDSSGIGRETLIFKPGTTEFYNTASFIMRPFNGGASMAAGHGLVNLENFCREFVNGQFPRLLHLTESSVQDKNYHDPGALSGLESARPDNFSRFKANVGRINVPNTLPPGTGIERLSDYGDGTFAYNGVAPSVNNALDQWYATGSLIKRNLSVLPNDNGLFKPNFNLLLSSSRRVLAGTGSNWLPQRDSPMSLFVDREGTLNLEIINLEKILDEPPGSNLSSNIVPEAISLETSDLAVTTGSYDAQTEDSMPDVMRLVRDGAYDFVSPDNPDGRGSQRFGSANRYSFLRYGLSGGDNSSPEVSIFTISDLYYGQKIQEGSVTIRDPYYTGSHGKVSVTLRDDRHGGLYRADAKTKHADWNNVGNVFYDEGVAIIKSPHIAHFGKDYFEIDFKGTQAIHVATTNVYAGEGLINSSSNPAYLPLSATLNANDTAPEFVYITSINLHDDNMNVIARANLAQPILKRFVEGFNFKIKMDY